MDPSEREVFQAFSLYDVDGDGFVTFEEMRTYVRQQLHAQASQLSEDALEEETNNVVLQCFREADANHDGTLSYDEFKRWYFQQARHHFGADGQRVRIPGATYCYLQEVTSDGQRNYVSANSLDPHVRRSYKNVFVAYIIEAVLDNNQRFRTLRRYSQLRAFVHSLRRQRRINIPVAFPPREIGHVHIEARRAALETYFRFLFKDPAIRRMEIVRHLLTGSDAADIQAPAAPKDDDSSASRSMPSPQQMVDVIDDDAVSAFGTDLNDETSTIISEEVTTPEERLKQLGVKIPTLVDQYWAKEGKMITVRLPVPATAIQSGDVQWAKEREIAANVLGQLSWAADGCLSALTILTLTGSAPDNYLQAVRGLLRNILGEKGRVVMHGQAAQEMQACFAAFDLNGDGYITLDELESGLKRMGSNVDPNSLHLLLEIADKNGDGRLDYQEFVSVIFTGRNAELEMRKAFNKFDKDGNGSISAVELRKTLSELGQNISLRDAHEIIAQADRNGDGQLDYTEFARMMRSHTPQPVEEDTYIIVTAHLTIDAELLQYQAFIQRLRGGIHLTKHGRKGNGVRKFVLDANRRKLTWRKGGLKAAAKGVFDLTTVKNIAVNPSNLRIFTLVGPLDSLILEAASAEERADLVDGFSKLLLRTTEGVVTDSQSTSSKNKKNQKTREQRTAELIAVFEEMDIDKHGFLGAVELGRAMAKLEIRVHQGDIERILASVDSKHGEYDYREFSWELTGVDDSDLQGKLARETQLIQLLQRFDQYQDGTISAVQVGQALANEEISQDLLRVAQHEAQNPQTHRIYYRQFARIVCGLDEQVNAFIMSERTKRQTNRLVELRTNRLGFHKERLLASFSRFDPRNDGFISLVDIGQGLGSLNISIPPDRLSKLTAQSQIGRDGRLKYNPTLVNRLADYLLSEDEESWQSLFRRWDKNKDGLMSVRELQQALAQIGQQNPLPELEGHFRKFDRNGDGLLDFAEFVELMLAAGDKLGVRN